MAQREHSPPALPLWLRVERERVAKVWTKSKLARKSGVARTTIDRLQANQRRPLPETVVALADALDIPRQEAFALAGLEASTAVVEEAVPLQPESDPELDWLLARIPERERRKLEQAREEERALYRWRLEQAREEYRRREEMMRRELEHGRKSSGNTDDQEGEHSAGDTSAQATTEGQN